VQTWRPSKQTSNFGSVKSLDSLGDPQSRPISGRTSMSYCKCQSLYWQAITGMLTRDAEDHVPTASGNSIAHLPCCRHSHLPPVVVLCLPPHAPCKHRHVCGAAQTRECQLGQTPWAYGCTRPQHGNPFAVVKRNKRMATGSDHRVKQHGITQDGAGTDTNGCHQSVIDQVNACRIYSMDVQQEQPWTAA